MSVRLKAGQPPLENEGHIKGLHGIVIVVAQGDLPNAPLLHGLVQGPTAELGAQRAGVLLLLDVKNHVVDVALQQGIGYVQTLTIVGHRRKVHPLAPLCVAHVQGECLHCEGHGVEGLQFSQCGEQDEGVLAPGHPYGHPVTGLYHVIVGHAAADQGYDLIHGKPP